MAKRILFSQNFNAVDGGGNREGWRLSDAGANFFGAQAVYRLRRRA